MSAYSVKVERTSAITCPKPLGDRFQRRTLLCDSALSLPLAAQFDNYITWDILQFMALGQRCPTVASVEAVIVIKTCCDSILSPVCCITFRILCLVDLSAPKGLSNTGNPMVSVCMRLSPVVLQRGHRNGGFGVRACLKYGGERVGSDDLSQLLVLSPANTVKNVFGVLLWKQYCYH